MNNKNNLQVDVLTTNELLSRHLKIPNYQRPYVWTTENVSQLLGDIKTSMDQGKSRYRIGSIILNDKAIVDGQQRITTLCLIKMLFTKDFQYELKFSHSESKLHIKENYQFIKYWLETSLKDTSSFEQYLNEKCEYVVLTLTGKDSLPTAFKLFDSQNGTGKPLEAYNLLKAYHLRAMESIPETIKIDCDRTWEQATRYKLNENDITEPTYDILKHLFAEQLYRTRIWSRMQDAYSFSKKRISEFKGFTIDNNNRAVFPFQNQQLLLFIQEKFYNSFLKGTMPTVSRLKDGDDSNISPFINMNQHIVNGKPFFEYVATYAEIYKRMFKELDTFQLYEFKQFYKENCLKYDWRVGDRYLREVYKSLTMCLFDKFGEEILNRYYKILYILVYRVRREKKRIFYQTAAQLPKHLFSIILSACNAADLERIKDMIPDKVEDKFEFPPFDKILKEYDK